MVSFFLLLLLLPSFSYSFHTHFGSKTHYNFGADHILRESSHSSISDLERIKLQQCQPLHIYMIVRHGSRWPTSKYMDKFDKLQQQVINWTNPFTNRKNEGLLTKHGEIEAFELGQRIRNSNLRSLFEQGYHPRDFEFRSSNVIRSLQTAFRFAVGLFGQSAAVAISAESLVHDLHLRFHENCMKYQYHKPTALVQELDESLKIIVKTIARRVQERTGEGNLSGKSIMTLWNACKFETTTFNITNSACSFFDMEDAKELEYVEDVKDFWTKGFGHELNYEMTCELIKDMKGFLMARNVTGKFLFGHAETIMPMIARLGLYRDDKVVGYDSEMDSKRKWRTGVVTPFAANIGIIVYKCLNNKLVVDVRHNERSLDLSHVGCAETNLCSLEEFLRFLSKDGECDMKQVCTA